MTTSFFSGTNVAPEADSTNELIDTLTSQVATVTAANSQAQAAAVQAEASANNAKISETNVSTLAQQANTTLAQAQTAISSTNDAVTQTAANASTATNQANIATSQASASSTSATASATSATASANSATASANSASAAASSESNSAASAASALASKGAAATSEANSASSAAASLASKNAAGTSESNAAGSATAASNSASAASTSAGQASTSAGNAATSASQAAASATLTTNQTAYLAGKNVIINGDCKVAQRGSAVLTTGLAAWGGPDRFLANNANSAGGQFTQSQYAMVRPDGVGVWAVKQTVNTPIANSTGTNAWFGITQTIEGLNCYTLQGKPATVSFIFDTNVPGNYSFSICNSPTTYSFLTSFAAVAGPQKVVIPIPSIPLALSIPATTAAGLFVRIGALNAGGTWSGAPNSNAWLSGTYIHSNNAVNWGAAASNYIGLTELQFESGSVATPFERRSYALELALCQRYYQAHDTWKFWLASTGASQVIGYTATFPKMRAAPSFSYGSIAYGNCSGLTVEVIGTCNICYYTTSSGQGGVILNIANPILSAEL